MFDTVINTLKEQFCEKIKEDLYKIWFHYKDTTFKGISYEEFEKTFI